MKYSVPTDILYNVYWYRSGTNNTMRNHLKDMVEDILSIIKKDKGNVLDIGCNDYRYNSNTYALEQLGWAGVLIDNDPKMVKLCYENRINTVIEADATKIDWVEFSNKYNLKNKIKDLVINTPTVGAVRDVMLVPVWLAAVCIVLTKDAHCVAVTVPPVLTVASDDCP